VPWPDDELALPDEPALPEEPPDAPPDEPPVDAVPLLFEPPVEGLLTPSTRHSSGDTPHAAAMSCWYPWTKAALDMVQPAASALGTSSVSVTIAQTWGGGACSPGAMQRVTVSLFSTTGRQVKPAQHLNGPEAKQSWLVVVLVMQASGLKQRACSSPWKIGWHSLGGQHELGPEAQQLVVMLGHVSLMHWPPVLLAEPELLEGVEPALPVAQPLLDWEEPVEQA